MMMKGLRHPANPYRDYGAQDLYADLTSFTPGPQLGRAFGYSNLGFGVLGHLLELRLGALFEELVVSRVCRPLGLADTTVTLSEDQRERLAQGYWFGKAIGLWDLGALAGAGALRSTAADLLRFVQANMAPQQLDPAMRRAVEGTHVAYFRVGDMMQGLGWEQYAYPLKLQTLLDGNSESMIWDRQPARRLKSPTVPAGPTLYNKTGSTGGFGAYVLFVPDQKIGIVLLANRNYPIPDRVKAGYAILQKLTGAQP
jgi:beta-lactamase class C